MSSREMIQREKLQTLQKMESQEEAIQEITKLEPEYQGYLDRLSSKQRRRAQSSITAMRTGLHSIAPLVCGGPGRCLFFDRCPIPEVDPITGEVDNGPIEHYPIHRGCIMEKMYMSQKVVEYVQHLDVNPNNPIEMAIANDLAIIDLYKYRAVAILSSGDKDGHGQDFMRMDIVGFNEETGDAAYTTNTHPALEVIEQLEKRRERLIDKLMETRKAKTDLAIKLGQGTESNVLLEEIKKLRDAIEGGANVVDAEYEDIELLDGAI
jgi:hypothetical protein